MFCCTAVLLYGTDTTAVVESRDHVMSYDRLHKITTPYVPQLPNPRSDFFKERFLSPAQQSGRIDLSIDSRWNHTTQHNTISPIDRSTAVGSHQPSHHRQSVPKARKEAFDAVPVNPSSPVWAGGDRSSSDDLSPQGLGCLHVKPALYCSSMGVGLVSS